MQIKQTLKKMTSIKREIKELPEHFKIEEKALAKTGIKTWEKLMMIEDIEINKLAYTNKCSVINLTKLRGIAKLICELSIPIEKAALLIHSGISSSIALARYTPQELINRTNRLERILSTGRAPLLNVKDANKLISLARNRQI